MDLTKTERVELYNARLLTRLTQRILNEVLVDIPETRDHEYNMIYTIFLTFKGLDVKLTELLKVSRDGLHE